jgi:hypothetical protein
LASGTAKDVPPGLLAKMPGLLNIRYGFLEELRDDSAKLDLGYRLPKILQQHRQNDSVLRVFTASF